MTPADERRHPPGPGPGWEEAWGFDFVVDDGALAGVARLALLPGQGVSRYWAALVGDGRPLVSVVDDEAPLPRAGLEVRAEGLWCDHICETPLDHWTIGLEAFGVALEDPADAWGHARGEVTALGFDLEWEAAGPPAADDDGYAQPCRVVGEVLVGPERVEVTGWGHRDHAWGDAHWSHPWWRLTGRLDDGQLLTRGRPERLPAAVDLLAGEVDLGEVRARVRHPAPVAVPGGRLARALVDLRAADGRSGAGWLLHHLPSGGTAADPTLPVGGV